MGVDRAAVPCIARVVGLPSSFGPSKMLVHRRSLVHLSDAFWSSGQSRRAGCHDSFGLEDEKLAKSVAH